MCSTCYMTKNVLTYVWPHSDLYKWGSFGTVYFPLSKTFHWMEHVERQERKKERKYMLSDSARKHEKALQGKIKRSGLWLEAWFLPQLSTVLSPSMCWGEELPLLAHSSLLGSGMCALLGWICFANLSLCLQISFICSRILEVMRGNIHVSVSWSFSFLLTSCQYDKHIVGIFRLDDALFSLLFSCSQWLYCGYVSPVLIAVAAAGADHWVVLWLGGCCSAALL